MSRRDEHSARLHRRLRTEAQATEFERCEACRKPSLGHTTTLKRKDERGRPYEVVLCRSCADLHFWDSGGRRGPKPGTKLAVKAAAKHLKKIR